MKLKRVALAAVVAAMAFAVSSCSIATDGDVALPTGKVVEVVNLGNAVSIGSPYFGGEGWVAVNASGRVASITVTSVLRSDESQSWTYTTTDLRQSGNTVLFKYMPRGTGTWDIVISGTDDYGFATTSAMAVLDVGGVAGKAAN